MCMPAHDRGRARTCAEGVHTTVLFMCMHAVNAHGDAR
jgi:hypothetical protein